MRPIRLPMGAERTALHPRVWFRRHRSGVWACAPFGEPHHCGTAPEFDRTSLNLCRPGFPAGAARTVAQTATPFRHVEIDVPAAGRTRLQQRLARAFQPAGRSGPLAIPHITTISIPSGRISSWRVAVSNLFSQEPRGCAGSAGELSSGYRRQPWSTIWHGSPCCGRSEKDGTPNSHTGARTRAWTPAGRPT